MLKFPVWIKDGDFSERPDFVVYGKVGTKLRLLVKIKDYIVSVTHSNEMYFSNSKNEDDFHNYLQQKLTFCK